jgi:hypothetical protein
MQPYEFGMRVGLYLEKQAGWAEGDWIPSWGDAGTALAGRGGLAGQSDPMQRGLVPHLLAYSNPYTGVPTAAWDTGQHLYNGRYLSALGSVGEGALSFLPGFGFGGRMLTSGGKMLTRAGATTAGNTLRRGAVAANRSTFATKGRAAVGAAERAIAGKVQSAIPLAKPPVPAATGAAGWGAFTRNAPANLRNYVTTHPIQAAAGGLGPLDPLTAGSVARGEHWMTPEGRAYQQQMQQMQQPQMPSAQMPGRAPMPRPKQTTFRPKPMGTF